MPSFYSYSRALTYKYDTTTAGAIGRARGFTFAGSAGNEMDITYGYDNSGRFNSLAAWDSFNGTTINYAYTYAANSNLIASIADTPSGWTETMTYENNRDLLASIDGQVSTAHKATFGYAHDGLGRRTSVVESGELFSRYPSGGLFTKWTYNDRSEVTAAQSYFGSNINDTSQPVTSRNFGYTFDNIGSRTQSKVDTVATDYTNNALNQLTSRSSPASTWVTGLAPSTATVTVNGATAARPGNGEYYAKNVAASAATPLWQSLTASSSLGGSTTRYAYLAATPENYAYDLDGNVTDDGRWRYTWDAENRLTSMETSLAAYTVGVTRQYLTFVYDYLGRRVRKTVANWNGSAYIAAVDRKFIYNGWNLVAEHDALLGGTPAVTRYTWGLDLSKTLQDGGGVGGLLAIHDVATSTTHLPAYDANGNLSALVNRAGGAITAAYEYGAFGETLRATGSYAVTNNFRFSTKYTDAESGLLYYGRRYYSPTLGRWLGRDPIREKGGLNLYGFVGNNGANRWDVLGERWVYLPATSTNPEDTGPHSDWVWVPDPNDTVTPMTKVEVSDSKFSLPIIPPTTVTVPINLTPIVPSVPTVTFSPGNIDIVVPPVNTTQVSLDVLKKLCGTEAGRALVDAFNSGSRTVRQVSSNELSSNLQAAIKGTAGTSDEAAGVIYLFPDNMSGLVDYFGSNYNYSGSITDFTASTLVHENLHFNNPPMPGVSAGQEGRYEEAWVRQVTDTKLPSYGLPTIFGFNTFSQYLDTVKPTGTDLGTGRPTSDYGQKAPASVVSQLNAASSKLSGWDCSKVKK